MNRQAVKLFNLVKVMPASNYPDYIFKNNRDLTFSNEQKQWGFEQRKNSNGAVYADPDNNQKYIVIGITDKPMQFYKIK